MRGLRDDFEHRPTVEQAAICRNPEDVTSGIDDRPIDGVRAITEVKAVNHRFLPLSLGVTGQFKHYPAASEARGAATTCPRETEDFARCNR